MEDNYQDLINYFADKNKRTKKSFASEWDYFNEQKEDKIWEVSQAEMKDVFLTECAEDAGFFADKIVMDIGCGHGVITQHIAAISSLSIGVELSHAVVAAYHRNKESNAHFVQADLQCLPFLPATAQLVYCSGVLHHTTNTELSFSHIEQMVKSNGKICFWLYHPQQNAFHSFVLFCRRIFLHLPQWLTFFIVRFFIFPVTFLAKKIFGKKKSNAREEMVNLMDYFTPQYRYETRPEVAKSWLTRKGYSSIKITSTNQFGFSIVGIRQ